MTGLQFCEGCGKQASYTARFCGGCGRPFPEPDGFEPIDPIALPPAPSAAGASAAGEGAGEERELFDLHPLAIQSFFELFLVFLSLGVVWLILWFRRIDTRYWISSERIEVTTGVFNKKRQTIELFRIQDLELDEPLFLRLRASGNLVIRAIDVGEPEITLTGLPEASDVFEALRQISIDERQRHRVRLLEGSGMG